MTRPVLAIHGGCGAILRADLTPEVDLAARSAPPASPRCTPTSPGNGP
ncbi:hypothetical protein LAJ19_14955 (plasmid) [Deinococcus taeanensis]|nr:hypothetical protein [Deinococcus taeanensis]UBV44106.1 hypothetical protein LAJ19_14955 [Deinococcus taeanensis]